MRKTYKFKVMSIIFLAITLSTTVLFANPKGKIAILKRLNVGEAYTPRVLGLFIGIQDYEDPLWQDLKYPEKDVKDMVNFFTNNAALRLDYKMVLTQPEETTRDNILNHKLDEFKMKNSSDKDIVIVYFSSHGTLAKELITVIENGRKIKESQKVPYILTSDTKEGKIADSAIGLFKVVEWFERLQSQRKVLILDMCHSGRDGKSQLSPAQAAQIKSAKGISYTPMEDSKASIILSACPMGGTSYEDTDLKNSVYTHFLLEGMQLGDLNGDGAITISEAHNYSIDKTRFYTWERKKYKQIPATYSKILGKDPIVVNGTLSQAGNPTLFSYASANHDVEIFIDGMNKGLLPKGVRVIPGEYNVECVRNGKTLFNEKIKFKSGFDYMLPYFQIKKNKNEDNMILTVEGTYRNFVCKDIPKKLIPAGPASGFSFYRYGFTTDWLCISGGFDYGGGENISQYSTRAGIKLTKAMRDARFFIGPDLMLMNFRYAINGVEDIRIDPEIFFFCPGVEALVTYKFKNDFTLCLGTRFHYLSYRINSTVNDVAATQAFLSAGYTF